MIVRSVRKLVSLPVEWLAQGALMLNLPASVSLLSAAWRVGADEEVGRAALMAMMRFRGRAAARAEAERWLREAPAPVFAGFAGLLAMEDNDVPAAQAFLARGRELGDDPLGGLDWLDYAVAMASGGGAAVNERLDLRSDLPPDLARVVRTERMIGALVHREFDRARQGADRLLEVADDPTAEVVLWALARKDGASARAEAHLARATLPTAPRLYYQFLGCWAIGDSAETARLLEELRREDEALATKAVAALQGAGGTA